METSEDYYPRRESVRDNLGNVWDPNSGSNVCETQNRLRVGDRLEFSVSATDPMCETLSYKIRKSAGPSSTRQTDWQENNVLSVTITPEDVRKKLLIAVQMRSPRPYHAEGQYDGIVTFAYEVLPPQRPT